MVRTGNPLTFSVTAGFSRGDSQGYAQVRVVFEDNRAVVETLDGRALPGNERSQQPNRKAVAFLSLDGWRYVGEEHTRLAAQWQRMLSALYARAHAVTS